MQRNILITVLIVVVLASSFLLYGNQKKVDRGMKVKVESLMGSSVYAVWEKYEGIQKNKTERLSIDYIQGLQNDLSVVKAYSDIVDQVAITKLLEPIAEDFLVITDTLKKNYEKKLAFSQDDLKVYSNLIQYIGSTNTLLTEVYYIEGVNEGPQVDLKPSSDKRKKLLDMRNEIKEFASSLN